MLAVGREEGDPPLDGEDRVRLRGRRERLGRPRREDRDQADKNAPRGDSSFETASIHGCPTVRSAYVDFVKTAARNGMIGLKGYRTVGGIRASIYNAMPVEGAQALASFMRDFASKKS